MLYSAVKRRYGETLAEKVSLREWLSDAEFEWRQKLKPASLVIETDFTPSQVRTAKLRWGQAANALKKRGYSYAEIIKRYPALTLLILVGHAALDYEEGRFWERFWDDVGLARDQDFESALRHGIADLLTKFSLARFPAVELQHGGSKYVMLLALHAGIPVHCLRDLLDVINTHIVQGRQASGAALLAWLDEPGKEHRSQTLDVPVRNFLTHGAEFAVDILDRIIEFVVAVTDDPGLLGAELDSSTTGLPVVLVDELVTQLYDKPVRWSARNLGGVAAFRRPFVAYDPDDDEIYVGLPFPASGADQPWRVSVDGDITETYAVRQWGATDEASITRSVVDVPARELVVTHRPSDASAVLALVSKDDPLLTFSEKGQWIPRRDGLKDEAWVIYPEGNTLIDASTGEEVELRDMGSPRGWAGWRSALVELSGVEELQLENQGRRIGTGRIVRKDARPRFVLGEPVRGIRARDGRTVHSHRPWVVLPATRTEPPPLWRVRTRRIGGTEWIVDDVWLAAEEEAAVDPFDDDEAPQLGVFEILVSGPLGADARLVVFLAEGLWVEVDRAIRIPESRGLTACTAEIGADQLEIRPSGLVEFAQHEIEKPVDVHSFAHFERLMVVPPCVEVRDGEVGAPAKWHIVPQMRSPEDFALNRFVAVRAPGAELQEFAFVDRNGGVVQIGTRSRRKPGDVYELSTQQFTDAARMQQSGRLLARLITDVGAVDVTVLVVQPKRLGSKVELLDKVLDFGDVENIPGLSTYVWCATAPWLPPRCFPLVDGRVKLPATLIDAGELRCQLFIDDPWVAVNPPANPTSDAFRVPQDGWFEAGTEVQNGISRFLAGAADLPDTLTTVPEAWAALAQVHADGRKERAQRLVPVLVKDPRASLDSLGCSSMPFRHKLTMMMLSELVNMSFAADFTLNDLHADPWFGCMTEMADLPSLFNRQNDVALERRETIAYLGDKGGATLTAILRTGTLTPFADACFDDVILKMASVPLAQVAAAVHERSLVPRPLLDFDRRRLATYEAFLQRHSWLKTGWSQNFAFQIEMVLKPIKKSSPVAHDAIKARIERLEGIDLHSDPWMAMSVQSLTLAFMARLEACGRLEGRYLNRGLLTIWARLADLCPEMVAADLLMAEALVLHGRRGDLIGEDR